MAVSPPQAEETSDTRREDALVRWAGTESAPLVVLCGFLFLLGAYLRLKNFGYPQSFQFDEHHFVENARNYLNHRADWNDHPPLGKLFIAASIAALGDNAFAWRLPSLIFGACTVALAAVVARRLFNSAWAGLFAAAFASVDGFLVAYSRSALLDGALCAMGLLSLLAATLERKRLLLWGSIAAGVAMSVKFSGVGALVAPSVALLCSSSKRSAKVSALVSLGIGALAIYVVCYWIGFRLQGMPLGVQPV
ncbi:MAG TPA: glycosyltransferase family 39 protein, partial [Polyangiaceae bacterium]|nr:glycosyltransferase family 39 protein [Polyangiaceae bacterium]